MTAWYGVSFYEWLISQGDRNDYVGELSRAVSDLPGTVDKETSTIAIADALKKNGYTGVEWFAFEGKSVDRTIGKALDEFFKAIFWGPPVEGADELDLVRLRKIELG